MFHVGQKVVCVDAANQPGKRWEGDAPVKGAIYTITGMFQNHVGRTSLLLAEIQRGELAFYYLGLAGYGAWRFRPAVERKTDISIFTEMLTPKTKKVSA